jgi:transposase
MGPLEAVLLLLLLLVLVIAWVARWIVRRDCPRCGKKVRRGILDCPHCGFDFRTIGS